MDSMNKNREARNRETESRAKQASQGLRSATLLVFLALACAPSLHAQTVDLCPASDPNFPCGTLGKFINPLTVQSSIGETCNYQSLLIEMPTGKVWAVPDRKAGSVFCNGTPVDITNVVDAGTGQTPFQNPPAGPLTDGVIEVTDFTLQRSNISGVGLDLTGTTILYFISDITRIITVNNAINESASTTYAPYDRPIMIRATGNVTIGSGAEIGLFGQNGRGPSSFLRGSGGLGGPGGFNGGDGGNGGISPSSGATGGGAGGGPGGIFSSGSPGTCVAPTRSPVYLTTGADPDAAGPLPAIPAGNDLLTGLRGGSGGGGESGCTSRAGGGGGGGGGAILIASNGIITVNGTVSTRGGFEGGGCCQNAGAGGTIRLVAATIAGSGSLLADGVRGITGNVDDGILRMEAFTISYTGSIATGKVAAASAPGQVLLPQSATQSAFIKISKITNSANAGETVSPDLAAQDIAGRVAPFNPVSATMPDLDATPVSTVNVEFTVGPCPAFPAGKTVTLVVTPLDPAQGGSVSYTSGAIACGSPPHATITGVALPLGFSSFSAFTVLNIDTGGVLARMFPKTYEGESIEAVRLETGENGTEYVLIAASGKEFPYRPR